MSAPDGVDPSDIDTDGVAEGLEASDEDVTGSMRRQALGILVAFYSLVVITLAVAWRVGLIEPGTLVLGGGVVDVAWVFEIAIAAVVFVGVGVLVAAFFIWLPGSFLGGMTRAAGGFANGGDDE